ncbi:DUF423 domain-containing protein [Devosia sp. BK]|nr:DUF423 domain-containing protein [Devosia sp. BK]
METKLTLALRRSFMVLAGLLGALGVASAAAASHGSDVRNVAAISTIALAHAPVLLFLALVGRGRALVAAGVILSIGVILFTADLAMRQWLGAPLFPGAAPLGGGALIVGWIVMAISAAFRSSFNN